MKHILTILITLIPTICLSQFNVTSFFDATKPQLEQKWDTYFKNFDKITNKQQGYAINLLHKGKIIREAYNGYANVSTKTPFNAKTIHSWASISKLIVTVAVVQLHEKGKLSLNDPITRFIPELRKASKKFGGFDSVKILHMLNHSSQLNMKEAIAIKYKDDQKKYGKDIHKFELTQDFKNYYKHFKLDTIPGVRYKYSNYAYNLLATVIKRASEEPFQSYITKNIFRPLGMTESFYGQSSKYFEDRIAHSYKQTKDSLKTIAFNDNLGWGTASGALRSSMVDMGKFFNFITSPLRDKVNKMYEMVLPSKVLNKYLYGKGLTEQQQKQFYFPLYKTKAFVGSDRFTFTFVKYLKTSDEIVIATGGMFHYSSFFLYNVTHDFGLIYASNMSGVKGTVERSIGANLYNFVYRLTLRDDNIKIKKY